MSQQLTLNIGLRDGYRFESFYLKKNSKNAETMGILQQFVTSIEPQQNIIWGEEKSGKTHLLQACCAKEAETRQFATYIPLKLLAPFGSGIFVGLSHAPLIVIDDIDILIGDKAWEIALFNFINTCRELNQRLLMSCSQNPRKLECVLPDLASRLIWGGIYQLQALNDEDKLKAIQARAEQRGFKLTDRVIEYLYRRYPRDIESLMEILDKLDKESLKQKAVITIPFVRKVLNAD